MGKKRKLQKKIYASFYYLTGGRIKPPMDKSWASSCSPVQREYKNLCFISIHVKVTDVCLRCGDERIYRQSFFSEFAFLLEYRSMPGEKTIPWWMHKFMANTMSEDSNSYAIVSVSYDGLCKRL